MVGESAAPEKSVDLRRHPAQTDPLEGCIFYGMGDDLVFEICERSGRPISSYTQILVAFLLLCRSSSNREPPWVISDYEHYANDRSLKQLLRSLCALIRDYTKMHLNEYYHSIVRRHVNDEKIDDSLADGDRKNPNTLERFLSALDHGQKHVFEIYGCPVDDELMCLLAIEYLTDAKTLTNFLSAVFRRWRKVFAPGSPWFQRVRVHQCGQRGIVDRKGILQELEKAKLIPPDLSVEEQDRVLSKIGQWRSRDVKTFPPRRRRRNGRLTPKVKGHMT